MCRSSSRSTCSTRPTCCSWTSSRARRPRPSARRQRQQHQARRRQAAGQERRRAQGRRRAEVEVEPIIVYDVVRAAWDLGAAARGLCGAVPGGPAGGLHRRARVRGPHPGERGAAQGAARDGHDRAAPTTSATLNERFRLRFEDAGVDEMMDQDLAAAGRRRRAGGGGGCAAGPRRRSPV